MTAQCFSFTPARGVPQFDWTAPPIPEETSTGALSAFVRLTVYQKMIRVWQRAVSPGARNMLFYLVDNSVGWGRDFLQVSVGQMVDGTDWGLPPCGYSRRKVFDHIKELEQAGGITVIRRENRASKYIVNLDWEPDVGLPTPKRKTGDRTGTPPSDQEGTHYNRKTQETESSLPAARSGGLPSPKKVRETVPEQAPAVPATEVVRQTVEKSRARTATSDDLATVWRRAWAEGFDGEQAPLLSKKDQGILRGFLKRIPDGMKVLEWSLANWRGVHARQLAWATNPPKRPVAAWLMRFANEFAADYLEIAAREKRWDLSEDARNYRDALAKGMTHEEAVLEAGRRKAMSTSRTDGAKEQEKIAREREALRIEREHLDRIRRNSTVSNPVKREEKPAIDHGDNPWENGGGDVADFSDLPGWDGSDD